MVIGGFSTFYFEFKSLNIIPKIAISIIYTVGLVILLALFIYNYKHRKDTEYNRKDKLFYSVLFVIYTIGFLMFFEFDLWGYREIVLGLLLFAVLFVGFFYCVKFLLKNSFKNENTPIVLCSFGIIAFFIAISNADAGNIATASFSYKICVGLSYLIAISIYINHYIYKTSKENKMISKIIGIVFWGAIITISFPYYIQWCGLIGNNFETFVSVYAALLGGGITLAGVAWTIKDGNDKQKESMNLIEQERKEDERKKNTPYVKIVSHVITDDYLDIDIGNKSSLDNFTALSIKVCKLF